MNEAPSPLSLRLFLPLDIVLSVAIVASLSRAMMAPVLVAAGKAQLTEAMFQMSTSRVDVIEQIASDGVLISPAPDRRPDAIESLGKFSYRVAGSSLYAQGRLRDSQNEFRLSFNPAVEEAGVGWSVLWLCGLREPPTGWTMKATPVADNLRPEQIPLMCKHMSTH